jgi:hypothetical protein
MRTTRVANRNESTRLAAPNSASTPPAKVAADPERLALWNKEAKDAPIYLASGCGQARRYRCVNLGGDPPYPYGCTPSIER